MKQKTLTITLALTLLASTAAWARDCRVPAMHDVPLIMAIYAIEQSCDITVKYDGVDISRAKYDAEERNESADEMLAAALKDQFGFFRDGSGNYHVTPRNDNRSAYYRQNPESPAREPQRPPSNDRVADDRTNMPQPYYTGGGNAPMYQLNQQQAQNLPCGGWSPELIGCQRGIFSPSQLNAGIYNRGNYIGGAAGYYYEDPVEFHRRARKEQLKEENGDNRILGSEKLLGSVEVYIDGQWKGRASDYNSHLVDGTIVLKEGPHMMELVNVDTYLAVKRNIGVESRAVKEAMGQKYQDLRIDVRTFKEGGDAFPWHGTTFKAEK